MVQTKMLIGGEFFAGEGPPGSNSEPRNRRADRAMPHGGVKQSGYGKDMSIYGLEDYTVVRHVMVAH